MVFKNPMEMVIYFPKPPTFAACQEKE
jgi:hypothetical protein